MSWYKGYWVSEYGNSSEEKAKIDENLQRKEQEKAKAEAEAKEKKERSRQEEERKKQEKAALEERKRQEREAKIARDAESMRIARERKEQQAREDKLRADEEERRKEAEKKAEEASKKERENQERAEAARLAEETRIRAAEEEREKKIEAEAEVKRKAETKVVTPYGTATTKEGVTTYAETPEAQKIRELVQTRSQKILETEPEGSEAYKVALRKEYEPGLEEITKEYQSKGTAGSSMEAYAKAKFLSNRDTAVALKGKEYESSDIATRLSELGGLSNLTAQGSSSALGLSGLTAGQSLTKEQEAIQTMLTKLNLSQNKSLTEKELALKSSELGSSKALDLLKLNSMFYR